MSEPTTDKFYKLIRRNKGGSRSQASSLIVDGREISSQDQQRKSFAQYLRISPFQKMRNMIQPSWNCVILAMNLSLNTVKKMQQY